MNTRFLCACVFALALTLTLGPALPAGAAPATGDHQHTPALHAWLTDGLAWLGNVAGRLGLVGTNEDPDADDGSDDDPVILDDDDGEELRPERIGYGLTAAPQ